jgi:hypothetical protein
MLLRYLRSPTADGGRGQPCPLCRPLYVIATSLSTRRRSTKVLTTCSKEQEGEFPSVAMLQTPMFAVALVVAAEAGILLRQGIFF